MAGTRTAPATTGAETSLVASLGLIDASGDLYSESLEFDTAPDNADLEAWVAAYQAATQASVWRASLTLNWEGVADTNNAENNLRYGVESGVNLLFKQPSGINSLSQRLVSPLPATMQGNQDIPFLSNAPFPALLAAYLTLIGGTYDLYSGQYTTRKERKNNPRIVT